MLEIRPASTDVDLDQIRLLFREYWKSFGFSPCFQGFEEELAGLPGKYAPPVGILLLALVDGEPAGCVALRAFDAVRAEAKRLYVRPGSRGTGTGRALMNAVIEEARRLGYRELVGDTLPEAMTTALAMYDRMGFERVDAYSVDPTPGAVFLRLRLTS